MPKGDKHEELKGFVLASKNRVSESAEQIRVLQRNRTNSKFDIWIDDK